MLSHPACQNSRMPPGFLPSRLCPRPPPRRCRRASSGVAVRAASHGGLVLLGAATPSMAPLREADPRPTPWTPPAVPAHEQLTAAPSSRPRARVAPTPCSPPMVKKTLSSQPTNPTRPLVRRAALLPYLKPSILELSLALIGKLSESLVHASGVGLPLGLQLFFCRRGPRHACCRSGGR